MKNYKNLNRSIKTGFALLAVSLVSLNCSDDILDQPNPNALTPQSFWQTAEDAEKGIIGAYSPFTSILYYSRFEVFLSDYRDDVINGFGTSDRTQAGFFNTNPAGNPIKWVWQSMYQGVTRSNEVLFRVPDIEMDEATKNNILGEAHFIRAFNYFNLLNNWKNIPLITIPFTEIDDPQAIVQANPSEVWALIEADLQAAQSLLPVSWPADQTGRATSGAAQAYLGKAYLYQEKFAEAKVELQKVISSGNYQLMDNYAHNFTEEFENNAESLFEIQLIADGNSGWGGDAPNRGKGSGFQPDFAPAGFTNQDGMTVNQWALDLFLDERTINDEIDPRTYTTFFWNTTETTTYEGETLESRTYTNKAYTDVYDVAGTDVYGNKWTDWEFNNFPGALAEGWHGAGNNLRMMRYADVLLMFTEAEFMLSGSTAVALDAINQVRERADMTPFTSITMQDIEDERVKELTFERTRYFDLLRWGKVVEQIVNNPADVKSRSAGTSAYKPGREYMAIPQNEIDQNPNIVQNPGY